MRLSNLTTDELIHCADVENTLNVLLGTPTTSMPGLNRAAIFEELIDRRTESASELRQLERRIAYLAARADIDSNCSHEFGSDDSEWFDVSSPEELAAPAVKDAVRLLDLRGLIERDPDDQYLVHILDESEATA